MKAFVLLAVSGSLQPSRVPFAVALDNGAEWDPGDRSMGMGSRVAPAPDGAGIVMFGGLPQALAQPTDELWQLRWDASDAVYETCIDVDVDGDGKAGCTDLDCAAQCSACGNGTCDAFEQCYTCPQDCGTCPATCGDFVCSASETCPGDCP